MRYVLATVSHKCHLLILHSCYRGRYTVKTLSHLTRVKFQGPAADRGTHFPAISDTLSPILLTLSWTELEELIMLPSKVTAIAPATKEGSPQEFT
jgi:hypothetical protein